MDALYFKSTQILKKALVFSVLMLSVTSVSAGANFNEDFFSATYLDSMAYSEGLIISDADGYLTKISPQTTDSDRAVMTDKASHLVAQGETLGAIAVKYGISEQTIIWENNLPNKNSLRVGQTLSIPPVDGVTHAVTKGQTLDRVAKLYGVEADLISKQNRLDSQYLYTGQDLIIPGGKLIIPAMPKIIVQREGVSRAAAPSRAVPLSGSTAQPSAGKILIYPTRGKITQYYHRGHYAVDIADASMPPVWAAAGGTVEKVSTGTWGGGYGNHVIIDHGNGYKSLYAHLNQVSVSEGAYVSQGHPIGQMGNTGRVYGRTGIHLHFEVRLNGVKVNPTGYF